MFRICAGISFPEFSKRENKPYRHMESEAVRILQRYNWPGNVRELQNIIERASVLETEPGAMSWYRALIEPWLKEQADRIGRMRLPASPWRISKSR